MAATTAAAAVDDILQALQADFKAVQSGTIGVIRGYCTACDGIITDKDTMTYAQTLPYHAEHFVCNHCSRPLINQPYFADDSGGTPRMFCEDCYQNAMRNKCTQCQLPIMTEELKYKDRPFHPECFTCSMCHTSLAGASFIEQPEDKVCCVACYENAHSPTCSACGLRIKVGAPASAFGSGEKKTTFHRDCLKCKICGMSAPKVFIRLSGDGQLYCDNHQASPTTLNRK
ncbi:Four and a half LIM domains protein 2 [Sorochytrium milnesiophthora]